MIYVGKAKNLRNRAGALFPKAAAEDRRTAELVKAHRRHRLRAGRTRGRRPAAGGPADQGHPAAIQHRAEGRQDVSRICRFASARSSRASSSRASRGAAACKLYGPFTSAKSLRQAIQVLQRIFKFRTCSLDIRERRALALVPPVPAAQHPPVHRPVQFPRQPGGIPQADPPAAAWSSKGKKDRLHPRDEKEMQQAMPTSKFEKAARLRDEIAALQKSRPARRRR